MGTRCCELSAPMGEDVRHTEAACELHTPLHAVLLGQRSKASVDEKSIYAFKKFYIQHAVARRCDIHGHSHECSHASILLRG